MTNAEIAAKAYNAIENEQDYNSLRKWQKYMFEEIVAKGGDSSSFGMAVKAVLAAETAPKAEEVAESEPIVFTIAEPEEMVEAGTEETAEIEAEEIIEPQPKPAAVAKPQTKKRPTARKKVDKSKIDDVPVKVK